MMLLAVSDVVWQALIAACLAIVLAVLKYSSEKRADDRAAAAALKVEEVKTTLDASTTKQGNALHEIQETTTATHTLVNSASLVQLRLYAVAARRIAGLTGNKDDLEAADLAEKLALDHAAKQDKVDADAKAAS